MPPLFYPILALFVLIAAITLITANFSFKRKQRAINDETKMIEYRKMFNV